MWQEKEWDIELTIEQSNDVLPEELISITDKASFDALTDLQLDENFKVQETTDNKFIFVINWVSKFYVEDEATLLKVVDLYCEKLAEEEIGSYEWITSIEVSRLGEQGEELTKLNIELIELEQKVETLSMSSILSGTKLEKTQIGIYESWWETDAEKKFETFTENTNTAVKTYLASAFGFKDEVYEANKVVIDRAFSNMSVGIQFAMMETLASSGDSEGVADFFGSFAGTDMTDGKSAFTGLLKSFSKGGSFLTLAKDVERCVSFLALNKKELLITKPVHPIFNDAVLLKSRLSTQEWNIENMKDTREDEITSKVDQEKALKNIAEDEILSKKMTSKLLEKLAGKWDKKWAVTNAITFLEERWKYKESALDLMGIIDNVFDFNIPLVWSVGRLFFDADSFTDVLNNPKNAKHKWIASFVLRLFGYEGVDGLVKEYKKEQIDNYMDIEETEYVTSAYSYFVENKDADIKNGKGKSVWNKLKLDKVTFDSDTTKNESMKDELKQEILPADYNVLVDALGQWFGKNPTISQEIFSAMQVAWSNVANCIDENSMQVISWEEDKFAEKYIEYAVPQLLSNTKFMKYVSECGSATEKKEAFLVGMFGYLVAGKCFLDGIDVANVGLYTWDVDEDEKEDENKEDEEDEKLTAEERRKRKEEKLAKITFENYVGMNRIAGLSLPLKFKTSDTNVQEFIKFALPFAKETVKNHPDGIPSVINILTQGAYECWRNKAKNNKWEDINHLSRIYHNYFWIKMSKDEIKDTTEKEWDEWFPVRENADWEIVGVWMKTAEEYVEWELTPIYDWFKVFPSAQAWFDAYGEFVQKDHYTKETDKLSPVEKNNPAKVLSAFWLGWYATSFSYMERWLKVMKKIDDAIDRDAMSPPLV